MPARDASEHDGWAWGERPMLCEAHPNSCRRGQIRCEGIESLKYAKTALLTQEGSVIAKQSREGWFQSRNTAGFRFGTTPARLLLMSHPS